MEELSLGWPFALAASASTAEHGCGFRLGRLDELAETSAIDHPAVSPFCRYFSWSLGSKLLAWHLLTADVHPFCSQDENIDQDFVRGPPWSKRSFSHLWARLCLVNNIQHRRPDLDSTPIPPLSATSLAAPRSRSVLEETYPCHWERLRCADKS